MIRKKMLINYLIIILILLIVILIGCPPPESKAGDEEKANYSFTLSLTIDSTGSGSIDEDNSTGNGSYVEATSITARVIADAGSVFMGWYDAASSGTQVSHANPYTFALNYDTTLYAKFIILNMISCSGGTFPFGILDFEAGTVDAFWIAETEVTYELYLFLLYRCSL